MRLLVVEDDDAIADPLVAGLGAEHFEVERARTAAEAMEAETPDLILLDLGLPDRDGLELVTELRRRSPVPILIITARGEETERVVGLNLGADDDLVAPNEGAPERMFTGAVAPDEYPLGRGREEHGSQTGTDEDSRRGQDHTDDAEVSTDENEGLKHTDAERDRGGRRQEDTDRVHNRSQSDQPPGWREGPAGIDVSRGARELERRVAEEGGVGRTLARRHGLGPNEAAVSEASAAVHQRAVAEEDAITGLYGLEV